MHHDDGRPAVEFVVPEAGGGADEELRQPVGFPRLRRARLPLFIAAAVALVVLIAVNIAAGPSDDPSAAPATVTVSPSPSRPAPGAAPASTRDGCPLGSSCAVVHNLPAGADTAVHRVLPRITRLRAATTIVHGDLPGSALLSRRITGRVGTARVLIEIRPAAHDDRIIWNASENAARTQVSATHHSAGQFVSARLTAPPGYDIDIPTVRRLAAARGLGRLT